MLGKVAITPQREWNGIRFWLRCGPDGFQVFEVTGVEVDGDIIHFEEYRTKYPHTRHIVQMRSSYFKPFLIPGGKQK